MFVTLLSLFLVHAVRKEPWIPHWLVYFQMLIGWSEITQMNWHHGYQSWQQGMPLLFYGLGLKTLSFLIAFYCFAGLPTAHDILSYPVVCLTSTVRYMYKYSKYLQKDFFIHTETLTTKVTNLKRYLKIIKLSVTKIGFSWIASIIMVSHDLSCSLCYAPSCQIQASWHAK